MKAAILVAVASAVATVIYAYVVYYEKEKMTARRNRSAAERGTTSDDLASEYETGYKGTFRPRGQPTTMTTWAGDSSFVSAGTSKQLDSEIDFVIPGGELQDADGRAARLAMHGGAKAKKSIDGAVRATTNRFARVFQNELDDNEKRCWYSSEAADDDMDFITYY
jgi:hypothetical protein